MPPSSPNSLAVPSERDCYLTPTPSPELSDRGACPASCAHHWALKPSGSFLPGTPISQITCSQLEDFNLTALTIFAESLAARPRCRSDSYSSGSPAHTYHQPCSLYYSSSARLHGDSKAWSAEYRVSADEYVALIGSWPRLTFNCLQERLFYYTAGAHDNPSEATLTWYWESFATGSQLASTGGSKDVRLYGVKLCESTFIQSLLLPGQTSAGDLGAKPIGRSAALKLKRSRSSPELRDTKPRGDIADYNAYNTPSFVTNPTQLIETPASSPHQSAAGQLATIARSELIKRTSASGNDLVQSVSGAVGAVATVVGSVASVALWMRKRNNDHAEEQVEPGIELHRLDRESDGEISGVPPSSAASIVSQVQESVSSDPRSSLAAGVGSISEAEVDMSYHGAGQRAYPYTRQRSSQSSYLYSYEQPSQIFYPYSYEHSSQNPYPYSYEQSSQISYPYPYGHPSYNSYRYAQELEQLVAQHDLAIAQLEGKFRSEKQKRQEVEREKDDLLRQLVKREATAKDVQVKRYKIVLQELLTTCRRAELEKARLDFEALVEAEVRSRIRPQTKRVEAEAKRQKHNREVQDELQITLETKVEEVNKRFAHLREDQAVMSRKQGDLAAHQRTQALEDARLRAKAEELLEIQQLLSRLARKQEETSVKEKTRLAAMAKDLQAKEKKWKSDVFQQRLELTRREARMKARGNDG